MGYSTRPNSEITDFWPDDDANTLHIHVEFGVGLTELLNKINEKWPDAAPGEIYISSEKIHTRCIYYDCYDPSDYDDFIIITRKTGD